MPEENLIAPVQIKPKKPRRKAVKKKIDKSPFKLSENLAAKPAMPKADFKVGQNLLVKKCDPKKFYRRLAVSFAVLTAVLLGAVWFFTFAKVKIVIISAKEKIADSLTVEVVNQGGVAGQIAGVVKPVPLEETKTFVSSGREVLGEEVTGRVTIVNNYIKNQPLVATTRLLSSDNKLFRIKNTVNVPAGGQVTAEVYADEPKKEMAIGPSKFTIPGLWAGIQDKIYAQSQAAMKYSEKIKYTIRQSDLDNAVKELKNNLQANAGRQLGQAYSEYSQRLYQVDNNSINQEVSGKVGEEKRNFTIKMKAMVTLVAFGDDDIYERAKTKLAATLADDKQIAEFTKQNMSYSLAKVDLNQGTAEVKVNFEAKATLKDSAKVIKKTNLAGMNYEQLKAYLNSLPEVAGYEIKFLPAFIKKAPNLVDRIEIEIKK